MKAPILPYPMLPWLKLLGLFAVASASLPCQAQVPTADEFDPGGGPVMALAVQADGKVLVGGSFVSLGGQWHTNFGRLCSDGAPDTGFVACADGYWVHAVAVQPDGKILLGGAFDTVNGQPYTNIARLNADGTLDTGFNPGADVEVVALALQPDGKILVGGYFLRLGGQARNFIGRLNADGSLDTGFNASADASVHSVVLQTDNEILVGGDFRTLNGQTRNGIGRLNASGILDTAFNPGAGDYGYVYSLALQADGKILVGGAFGELAGSLRMHIGRLYSSGALDTTFDPSPDSPVHSIGVQADGKILLAGEFQMVGNQGHSAVARLNANGSVDSGFTAAVGWAPGSVSALALQADGKILVGGNFHTLNDLPRYNLGRFNSTGPAIQSLTYGSSTLTWSRGGTTPEVWRTTFEYTTNGTDWISLGAGTRITGGWQRTGFSRPPHSTIRARGFVTGGEYNGSSWFVETIIGPPLTLTAPSSQTNNAGTTAAFSVLASGTAPMSYQWLRDSVALADGGHIAGAATSLLTVSNVLRADGGGYSVVISNAEGSVTSTVATLTVIDPCLSSQPVSRTNATSQTATFAVQAVGTALTYQWRKNGEPLDGGVGPVLTLTNVQFADAGNYTVVVCNPYSCVTSQVASLMITLPTLNNWYQRNASEEPLGDHGRMTFGNGTFVVVGSAVWTSTNGAGWTQRPSGTSAFLASVAWGDGQFIAVGENGAIRTSPDAVTWAGQSSGTNASLFDVTYGNGTFVAVGAGGVILTSTNGTNWISADAGTNLALYAVTYGNGSFVAVGGDLGQIILTSDTGGTWTIRSFGLNGGRWSVSVADVAFGNGLFVAIRSTRTMGDVGDLYSYQLLTSTDGVSWSSTYSGSSPRLSAVTYGRDGFVVVGSGCLRSTNGVDWVSGGLGAGVDVAYGNGLYVAIGARNVLTSPDAVNWSRLGSLTMERLCSVTWGGDKLVAVGFGGTVLTSPDGRTWFSQYSGTPLNLYSVAYGNGMFVAVGQVIISSTNGVDWTIRDSGVGYDFETVAYLNHQFMAVGFGGSIKVSTDGITWSSRPLGPSVAYGLAYGNGQYVVVGTSYYTLVSSNGIDWVWWYSGTPYNLNGVTFARGLFVAQGNAGYIFTSLDGTNWTSRTSGTTVGLTTSTYGLSRFVMVGDYGVILTSTNGLNWERASSGASQMLLGVCATPDSFVAVGDSGTILQSDNFPPLGIWRQPQSRVVEAGSTACLSVEAGSSPPLSFQWFKDGLALTEGGRFSGVRRPLLTVTNAQPPDSGDYRVIVANAYGSVTSMVATLTVGASAYVTARPSPFGTGANLDGTYHEFTSSGGKIVLADSGALSGVTDAPPRNGSRAYLSSTTLTDLGAGFSLSPTLSIPGGIYRLDHTFNAGAGNINTDLVLAVTCTRGTLSVTNTDKFQARFGDRTWHTIGYLTNDAGGASPWIDFRYLSGFVNGGALKRLNVDCFRFTALSGPITTPPTIRLQDGFFGFRSSQFGFNLQGVAGQTVVFEGSTNLLYWAPLRTNLLGGGPSYFFDPDCTNYPARFYRVRLQ